MLNFLRTHRATAGEYIEAFRRDGAVYTIRDDDAERVKIGFSRRPYFRMRELQVGCSGILRMVCLVAAPEPVEALLHRQFGERRLHGEWFDDRDGEVCRDITAMAHGEPIARSVWSFVPGTYDLVSEGSWTRLEWRPAA